jgi:hypothetical protein
MLYYQVQIVLADSYGQYRNAFNNKPKSLRHATAVRGNFTHGELKAYIREAESFFGAQPVWSAFKDRSGRTIEKCTFEKVTPHPRSERWRTTETIWIHKGYDRY